MIDDIQKSLGKYILAMNRGYAWVPFHQEVIIPALEAVEAGKIKRLMINMPPRHAKTELATINFIPWWIGKHERGNAMVASYSYELAKDFGSKIKARMESPLYKKIFPEAVVSKDIRSRNFLRTVSGGSFYAMGFDGAISGKGVSLAVLDDAIKNHEEAESELRQDFLMDIYESTIKARLEPTLDGFQPAIVIAMTRWGIRDFCGRVLEKEGRIDRGGDWTVLTLRAEPEAGTYLWEERFGNKHYEDAKRDENTWAALFQQEPDSYTSYWFKPDWLQFYDIPITPGKFNTYMLVDPAGSKGKKSDKTSIQVWAAGQDKKLFLADWVHDRLDPGERVATILRLTRKWKQRQTIYEEYGLVNDSYYITERMRESGFEEKLFPIPVGKSGPRHNLSKAERIKAIIPFFREGRIYLPRKFEVRLSDGKKVDLTKRFLDDEYSLYRGQGSIAHDDDLDCASRLLEPELTITYYEPKEERQGYTLGLPIGGAGWEATY
jgi:hypothetical protein